ncbi:HlyD family secretion protein [Pasteurella sp. PK-2025]|uniref:HlyD family secretion protein n=1 Tax=Pasteurella sp. PK-2025 TaxID=3413133 RepID=UPI003C72F9E9
MKKGLFLILILVIGFGVYWQQYHQPEQDAHIVQSNGRLEFARLDVASLYAGRVEQIFVQEGQYVAQDTLLATLSADSIQAQVDTAKAKVEQAQQAVKRTQAQFNAQQQQLNTAQLDVDNAQQLFKDKLISSSELTKRIALRDAAFAGLNALQSGIDEAESVVKQATAQLLQAQSVLNDLHIKAPKAGRIEYRLVELGAVIAPGHKIASIIDLTDASMNLFFPAPIVNQIPLNSEARILFDGLDAVFPAQVTYIASEAQFTPKFVETQSEREKLMFKVKLQIPQDIATKYADYLKAGMTGNGFVRLHNADDWSADLQVKLPKE